MVAAVLLLDLLWCWQGTFLPVPQSVVRACALVLALVDRKWKTDSSWLSLPTAVFSLSGLHRKQRRGWRHRGNNVIRHKASRGWLDGIDYSRPGPARPARSRWVVLRRSVADRGCGLAMAVGQLTEIRPVQTGSSLSCHGATSKPMTGARHCCRTVRQYICRRHDKRIGFLSRWRRLWQRAGDPGRRSVTSRCPSPSSTFRAAPRILVTARPLPGNATVAWQRRRMSAAECKSQL